MTPSVKTIPTPLGLSGRSPHKVGERCDNLGVGTVGAVLADSKSQDYPHSHGKLHFRPKVTKMESKIGHRIDYDGVGALRGQWHIPSKN